MAVGKDRNPIQPTGFSAAPPIRMPRGSLGPHR